MKLSYKPGRKKSVLIGVLSLLLLVLPGLLSLSGQSKKGKKFLPYGILDYGQGKSKGRTQIIKKDQPPRDKVHFANRQYGSHHQDDIFFSVKIGYNKIGQIYVVNKGDREREIKVLLKAPENLPMGINGAGGESFIKIPARRTLSLPVKIFTQDAGEGFYDFSVRLKDVSGKVIDESRGRVYVYSPEMKISIKKIGAKGLLHEYEVSNHGEELGNFNLKIIGAPGISMNPRVEHYLFPAGKTLKIALYPTGKFAGDIRGRIQARSAGVEKEFPFQIRTPAGQEVQLISLDPIVRLRRKDWYCTNRPIIHLDFNVPYVQKQAVPDVGFTAKFTWLKSKGRAFDTNRNGKKDHWELREKGRVRMSGEDYNEDGEIDFFRESDSRKRHLNRAYVKIKNQWYATNIVDAYLVSSFLPMTDAVQLKPHDVDVLLNKQLISRRKKIIPSGTRVARIRLDYLAQNNLGYSPNRITVSTKHLKDSHYQVSAENTLVLHYSSIEIPVLSPGKIKLNTTPLDKGIQGKESELAQEQNEVKKELLQNQIAILIKRRDSMLKKAEAFIEKNKGQAALKLSGVQYRGLDLALYASELERKGAKLKGVVRNMGYSTSSYRVTVYSSRKGSKPKKLLSKKFPTLPPFARRNFKLVLPGYDGKKRTLYRIVVKARNRKKELVLSNNTSHLTAGPAPDTNGLREEMKYLAAEMGLNEDQVTLSRNAPIPGLHSGQFYAGNTMTTNKLFTSSPLKRADLDADIFILD